MYKVLVDFKDLRDCGYEYHAGDTYPREGLEVEAEKLRFLSTPTMHRGALIAPLDIPVEVEPVAVEADPVDVEPVEEEAEGEDDKPKKKPRKKAAEDVVE